MHHVHADDVAQAFEAAVARRDGAAGEDFNIVVPSALNVRGYPQIAAESGVQPAIRRRHPDVPQVSLVRSGRSQEPTGQMS
jgi:nucleoside-diphosphate-sugar epimerase